MSAIVHDGINLAGNATGWIGGGVDGNGVVRSLATSTDGSLIMQGLIPDALNALLDERVGLAVVDNIRGGPTLVTVDNQEDFVTYAEAGNHWITFSDSLTCVFTEAVEVGSNTTIDGRDRDGNVVNVTITGAGLHINNVTNVIVNNITITDTANIDDGIQANNSTGWVHRCTFGDATTNVEDGLMDMADGSRWTVSYCRFNSELDGQSGSNDHAMLVGNNQAGETELDGTMATLYRCWFNDNRDRMPYAAGGQAHVWECLVEQWSNHATTANRGGHALISGTLYYDTSGTHVDKAYYVPPDDGPGYIKAEGVFAWGHANTGGTESSPEEVFTPPYDYTFATYANQTEAEAAQAILRAEAGAVVP